MGAEEDFVALWGFAGSQAEADAWMESYGLTADVLLIDEDRSLLELYVIDEHDPDLDAFAMFPRNFVMDREGRIAYASAQVTTEGLVEAAQRALAD